MAVQQNMAVFIGEDALVVLGLVPPVPVSGVDVGFVMTKRLGGTPLVTKWYTSGFTPGSVIPTGPTSGQVVPANASGIVLTDPVNGVYGISFYSADTSGYDPGAYAFQFLNLTSGTSTIETTGFCVLGQSQVFANFASGFSV